MNCARGGVRAGKLRPILFAKACNAVAAFDAGVMISPFGRPAGAALGQLLCGDRFQHRGHAIEGMRVGAAALNAGKLGLPAADDFAPDTSILGYIASSWDG